MVCTIRTLIYKGLSRAQEGKDEGGRMKDERVLEAERKLQIVEWTLVRYG